MSLKERIDFEENSSSVGQENNLLKVDILNKMNELVLVEINKVVEENGLKLGDGFNLGHHLAEYEKSIIQHALELARHNQFMASQLLGIKYTTLNNKIKRYQLSNRDSLQNMNLDF